MKRNIQEIAQRPNGVFRGADQRFIVQQAYALLSIGVVQIKTDVLLLLLAIQFSR